MYLRINSDEKEQQKMMLDEIVDLNILDTDIIKSKGTYTMKHGLQRKIQTKQLVDKH